MRYCAWCTFHESDGSEAKEGRLEKSMPNSSWCSDACMRAQGCCSECLELDPDVHPNVLCPEHAAVRAR